MTFSAPHLKKTDARYGLASAKKSFDAHIPVHLALLVAGTTITQELVWLITNDLDFDRANEIHLDNRYHFVE